MNSSVVSEATTSAGAARVIRADREAIEIAKQIAEELKPGAAERDQERRVPHEELLIVGRSGLLGITIPREFGGADVHFETLAEVFCILGAADPAIAQVPQNHFVFVDVLRYEGTPEQKALFLPRILAGARLGNALAERGTSHTGDKRTRITRDPKGGFRLNGKKYYCTGAYTAEIIPVMAMDDDNRMNVAYVERDAEGLIAINDWTAMGQRSTISGTVELNNVWVEERRVIPHYKRYLSPQISGATAQLIHAAIQIGVGINALQDAVEFVRTKARPYFEAGVAKAGDDPHIIRQVGELSVRLHAAEELLRRAGRMVEAAKNHLSAETAAAASIAVAEAKAFGGDTSIQIASDIFSLAGASASDERYALDRHWRNVRTHTLHDPARWKYFHIGNYALNGMNPPNHGLI